jgi:hypothetical protein
MYEYPRGRRPWVAGNTLCYLRDAWRRRPFPEIAEGEDTRFLWSRGARRIVALEDHRFVVGIIHGANTSDKNTGDGWWRRVALAEVETLLGDDAEVYGLKASSAPNGDWVSHSVSSPAGFGRLK